MFTNLEQNKSRIKLNSKCCVCFGGVLVWIKVSCNNNMSMSYQCLSFGNSARLKSVAFSPLKYSRCRHRSRRVVQRVWSMVLAETWFQNTPNYFSNVECGSTAQMNTLNVSCGSFVHSLPKFVQYNMFEACCGFVCSKYYRASRYRMRCVTIVLVERRCTGCTNKWSSPLENNVY